MFLKEGALPGMKWISFQDLGGITLETSVCGPGGTYRLGYGGVSADQESHYWSSYNVGDYCLWVYRGDTKLGNFSLDTPNLLQLESHDYSSRAKQMGTN